MSQIRIANRFGSFVVESLDSNGVWVMADSNCTFETRDQAQECVDGFLDAVDGLVQVDDIEVG